MADIRLLDPIVASRIAAGEVVERPSSVLRELLDNSLDAKATKISVYIEEGGIKSLTVVDNGVGMSAEDLMLACVSHATSKIHSLDDLFNLKTLGFRGEALSSISACSKVTINSNGNRIVVDNGTQGPVMPGSVERGTSVCMENLFENIPARKLFLKRPQSEAADCKKTFMEKALGFEGVEFLLFQDRTLSLHLKAADKRTRCIDIMQLDKAFGGSQILQMDYSDENVSLLAICSDPSVHKRDRSQIRIFVNNRIIDSFQFTQAVANAFSAALPGGAFPFFYLFIGDNPSLVDFNIHPTKRECKLRNQSQIYGSITSMIRKALLSSTYSTDERSEALQSNLFPHQKQDKEQFPAKNGPFHGQEVKEQPAYPYSPRNRSVQSTGGGISIGKEAKESKPFDPSWFETARAIMGRNAETRASEQVRKTETVKSGQVSTVNVIPEYRYVGQIFDTFLVVELEDRMMLIDQHALHERLLYDEIRSQRDVQRLMVPYSFDVDVSIDEYLQKNSMVYGDFGIELTRKEPLLWEMASLPAACRKSEDQIVSYIREQTGDLDSVQKGLFAIIACHSAIKAGDTLDDVTARALVKKCFELDRMVCPHGRSFTYTISKEDLFKAVGRIV